MSAITLQRIPAKAGAPTSSSEQPTQACSREEEFRVALEHYIARYIADQLNGNSEILRGIEKGPVSRNAARWLRQLRCLQTATSTIGSFARALCKDWRHAFRMWEAI
jgi:hypothetical protein